MSKKSNSLRVGKVQACLRGRVWYLCYFEHGKRHRPRVGPDRAAARQLAAQINAQIEVGAPAALSFEPIELPECTAPKSLRRLFATALQEGRVDPAIRNELMGHAAAGERRAGHGLGMDGGLHACPDGDPTGATRGGPIKASRPRSRALSVRSSRHSVGRPGQPSVK
jgi:hypothetical protein